MVELKELHVIEIEKSEKIAHFITDLDITPCLYE